MIEALRSEAPRFMRFALVGGIGFAIDAGLLTLLHNGFGLDPYLARLLSISVSAFTTWRLNRRLTFGASPTGQASEGLRYGVVAGLTSVLNYLAYVLALTLFPTLPPLLAAVIATLVAMLFSYAGYSRFAFQGTRAAMFGSPSSQRR